MANQELTHMTVISETSIGEVRGDFASRNISGNNSGSTTYVSYGSASALEHLTRHDAAYNSAEREREAASVCKPGTRESVLKRLHKSALGDGDAVCWLNGPAGAGKSTIAHTVAEHYDKKRQLAFSYFFSREHTARSNLTVFVPTFVFELSRHLPAMKRAVDEAIRTDPRLFRQRIQDQLESVAKIITSFPSSSYPRIVVIDGLDEYNLEVGKIPLQLILQDLVNVLVDKLQLRILFSSRPEAYITEMFDSFPVTNVRLQDYKDTNEVFHYLNQEFAIIAKRRKLENGWPGVETVHSLAEKSEGIFAYTSTLLKFIDDRLGNPRRKLETVKLAHKGLDSLYIDVLKDAQHPEDPHFSLVLGAVMLLREGLGIAALASLLRLDSIEDVQAALHGCYSVLDVPDDLFSAIRPHHTSLKDYPRAFHRFMQMKIPVKWSQFNRQQLISRRDGHIVLELPRLFNLEGLEG